MVAKMTANPISLMTNEWERTYVYLNWMLQATTQKRTRYRNAMQPHIIPINLMSRR